ncbi:MAG: precorrin-6y C5,15-methyltransferase (decarboxylating) subunit CbiE [Cucumibacter sp.]
MNAPWLHVIGITERGLDGLDPATRTLLGTAHVIGPPRAIAPLLVAGHPATPWHAPLGAMLDQILARRGAPTVVLATGDPSWFGIGATLARHLSTEEFAILPAPSAFSLAAARLHWPLQDVACLSAHGRTVAALVPHIQPGARLLALTSGASTVAAIVELLTGLGYGESRLSVLNRMGGLEESRVDFIATEHTGAGVADFNTLAIECVAVAGTPLRPAVPGLPDEAFLNDGQLTKREVRAVTLARLAPIPGALLWDVGAGCGSVAIEWMRAARGARALVIERDASRRELIAKNAEALGTPDLTVSPRPAPEGFPDYERPDAIFLGGDVGNAILFEACWQTLPPGGRLVANAVTLDGEAALIERQSRLGGELVRISIERLDRIGAHNILRPLMPVTQWALVKAHEP